MMGRCVVHINMVFLLENSLLFLVLKKCAGVHMAPEFL